MTSCYREFNQKSKGNKGKKEQQQQLTLIIIRLQNIIFKIHSYSLLATYFSFPEFATALTQFQGITYMQRIPQRHRNFLFMKLLGDKTFTLYNLCCHRSREQCHFIEIIL